MPQNMNNAKICITPRSQGDELVGVAPLFTMGAKTTCASMAPTFPAPADKPCAVERTRVGNTSPGEMNVVAFGPS